MLIIKFMGGATCGLQPVENFDKFPKIPLCKVYKILITLSFIYNFIIPLICNFAIHINKLVKVSIYFVLSKPALFVSWVLGANMLNFFFSYSSSVGKNI